MKYDVDTFRFHARKKFVLDCGKDWLKSYPELTETLYNKQ